MTVKTRTRVLAVAALAALVLGAGTACDDGDGKEQNDPTANANYEAQKKNDPIPNLTDSLERANIIEHLKRNNQPDRVRYIYLLADTGGVYAYYVIKGKVTSTGAQLTPTDDIYSSSWGNLSIQGPTDDGSYGGDEGGIYFFTDTGVEVQWNGRWLLTDAPMTIKTPSLTLTEKK
ncbi:hypothetical protein [Micromonospora sp. WMMD737]|uniref:hypothetical protein n=1 Tax=Micromonospora sp. WMMD737 TaxID=3404113 RepID=UPI003B94FB45